MKIKLLKVVFYFVIVSFVIFNNIINAQYLDPNSFSSLGNFNPGSNVTVNMGTGAMSGGFTATGVVSGGILVFTFDTFTLNSGISITFSGVTSGGNKIAFLSKGDMTIAGNIYANASGSTPGPGGYKGGTGGGGAIKGVNGEGPGGGTGDNGDNGAGGGGFGGIGGDSGFGAPGGIAVSGDLAANFIGGSGGGQSKYAFVDRDDEIEEVGGGGGGALELGSKGILTLLTGCNIEAKGAAGGNAVNSEDDGNGGGSGGGILIHSRSVVINSGANINVSGGAGGNGDGDGIGCGGGGGGGGKVHIAYHTTGTITNNGNIVRSGGAGGTDTDRGDDGLSGPDVVPVSSNNDALPVELQSFTATPKKSKVILNWSTATEINNYGFEVERASLGTTPGQDEWRKIGFIEGSGNSNSVKEYSFTDNSVTNGKYSYRLKQIDTDGAFEYSDVVEVVVKSIPEFFSVAQNFPNPGNPTTNINFSLPKEGHVVVKVYDILGKEISTLLDETRSADNHSVTWNGLDGSGKEAASGIYLYNISFDGQSVTKKMLLIR